MVGEPHGNSGDFGSSRVDFDAVKLMHVAQWDLMGLPFNAVEFYHGLLLKRADFTVGNNKKIATAASGVKNIEHLQFFDKRIEFFSIAARLQEFGL